MPSGRYNRAMPTTHQQIESWKARLLDLGRRNRLLHTRPGLAGTVALTDLPVAALFDALVRGRRKLTFAAALTLEQRLAALEMRGIGGACAADKGTYTRDCLADGFPETRSWECAGANGFSAGMADEA